MKDGRLDQHRKVLIFFLKEWEKNFFYLFFCFTCLTWIQSPLRSASSTYILKLWYYSFSFKGATGVAGERGPIGPKGDRGERWVVIISYKIIFFLLKCVFLLISAVKLAHKARRVLVARESPELMVRKSWMILFRKCTHTHTTKGYFYPCVVFVELFI